MVPDPPPASHCPSCPDAPARHPSASQHRLRAPPDGRLRHPLRRRRPRRGPLHAPTPRCIASTGRERSRGAGCRTHAGAGGTRQSCSNPSVVKRRRTAKESPPSSSEYSSGPHPARPGRALRDPKPPPSPRLAASFPPCETTAQHATSTAFSPLVGRRVGTEAERMRG
jgi:hypothetical protein